MSELEIREYYGEEALPLGRLSAMSLHLVKPELALSDEEAAAACVRTDEKLCAMEALGIRYFRLGAFLEGRLTASLDMRPQAVRFDGHTVPSGHIGDVCSEPELRRTGAVRKLFTALVNEMYDRGVVLSNLAPFTANFYRKFGYEPVCENVFWTIPTEYLPAYTNESITRYVGTDEQKAAVREIYGRWSEGMNFAQVRTDPEWDDWFETHKPFGSGFYGYLHWTNGKPDGFFCYQTNYDCERPMLLDMTGGAFWYTDPAGLRGILAYAAFYKDYARALYIKLPRDADLTPLIEITGGWGRKLVTRMAEIRGTARVVNVKRALELAAYRGRGRVCIEVSDPSCERNCGAFTVDFDGRATSVVTGGVPDVRCSIGAFSAMLLGRGGIETGELFAGTEVLGDRAELDKVFYRKPVFYN